jgi:hypothetical protein
LGKREHNKTGHRAQCRERELQLLLGSALLCHTGAKDPKENQLRENKHHRSFERLGKLNCMYIWNRTKERSLMDV